MLTKAHDRGMLDQCCDDVTLVRSRFQHAPSRRVVIEVDFRSHNHTKKPALKPLDLPDASLQAHSQEFLRLHGKLHRQFAKYLLTEAIYDHIDCVFRRDAALAAVKKLV